MPSSVATFYGRDREIRFVLELLQKGSSVAIVGPHGSGKTALIHQIVEQGKIPDSVFALLSLNSVGTPIELLNDALRQIAGSRTARRAFAPVSSMIEFAPALRSITPTGYRVILFIDDFDLIENSTVFTQEFLAFLRRLTQEGQALIVTASTQDVSQLVLNQRHSPLTNMLATIHLGDLSENDAVEILLGPLRANGLEMPSEVIDKTLAITPHQPRALLIAGNYLYQIRSKRQSPDFDFLKQHLDDDRFAPDLPSQSKTASFAANDRPEGPDRLGYEQYAHAFARVLSSPQTQPPLTVGIYASWGMGKSFLMRKIAEKLQTIKHPQIDFLCVNFNAWIYSGSENLWAGFITHLYAKVEDYFGWRATTFRLGEGFRRSIKKALSLLGLYGILGFGLSLLINWNELGAQWDAIRTAFNTLAGAALLGTALAALPPLLRSIQEILGTIASARSKQLALIASKPDFRDKIGFMADVKDEIVLVKKMLNKGKRGRPVRLVIFIDDLDRCSTKKAVEVLEAIMLLLAEESESKDGREVVPNPFIVFLGIDARIIVKAIEEIYGKVMTEAGISGYEYLDRLVQIPFCIPHTDDLRLSQLLDSLLPTQTDSAGVDNSNDKAKVVDENNEAAKSTPSDGSISLYAEDAVQEAPTEVFFTPFEHKTFKDFAHYMSRNPRRIKRCINVYSITRLIAAPTSDEEIRKRIKWTLLTERWPFRMSLLLQEFARGLNNAAPLPNAELGILLRNAMVRLGIDGTHPLITLDENVSLFDEFTAGKPALNTDDLAKLKTLTFNLNPAIQDEILKMTANLSNQTTN